MRLQTALKTGVLLAGMIFYGYYGFYKMIFVHYGIVGGDFIIPYRAAHHFSHGLSLYSPVPNCSPFLYPPFPILLYLPFLYFKQNTAVAIWFGLTHVMIFLSAWLLYKMGGPIDKRNSLVATVAVLGFSMPLYGLILTGNINVLVLLGLCLMFYLLISGKTITSPLILAILFFLKLYPATLVAAFFNTKQYKQVLLFVASCIVLLLTSLGIFGIAEHEHFLQRLSDGYRYVKPFFYSGSFTFFLTLIMNIENRFIVSMISLLFGLLLLLIWWRTAARQRVALDGVSTLGVDLFILSIVAILVFPAANDLYHFMCIIPFYFIILARLQYAWKMKGLFFFAAIFVLINFWEIITYQLPLPFEGVTIRQLGERPNDFPILYPVMYSVIIVTKLAFFFWLLVNYHELKQWLSLITAVQNNLKRDDQGS